jgi:hypothetical protein
MKPTYYGAVVRIERRGAGLDGLRVVQRLTPVSNEWIDLRTFPESSDYCSRDSVAYALALQKQIDGSLVLGI